MPAIIAMIAAKAKLAGILLASAAALSAAIWVWNLYSDNGALRADKKVLEQSLEAAISTSQANLIAFQEARAEAQRAFDILAVERTRREAAAREISVLRGMINHAPEIENGPIARVLRNTLDELRRRESRARGDADPDRTTPDP